MTADASGAYQAESTRRHRCNPDVRASKRARVSRGAGTALAVILGLCLSDVAWGGEADIVGAEIERMQDGRYRFHVAVRHADTGWDHYADAWEVVSPDGTVLATRELLHPHVDEQPFVRSLGGVRIPKSIGTVTIRARDSVHGHGGRTMTVNVPR